MYMAEFMCNVHCTYIIHIHTVYYVLCVYSHLYEVKITDIIIPLHIIIPIYMYI